MLGRIWDDALLDPFYARALCASGAGRARRSGGGASESARLCRAGCDALPHRRPERGGASQPARQRDRKSTRLNSSHTVISYAVFCLKKKKKKKKTKRQNE